MRNLFYALLLMVGAVSCTSVNEPAENADDLAVSILPQKYFVEQIAGDAFQVHVLIPPGASPATFDPSPKDLTKIADARAYLKIGHIGFEKAWGGKVKNMSKTLRFYDLSDNISLISADDAHDPHAHEDHEEHGHHHHGVDPHIWLSVKNAKIIAGNILHALEELKPEMTADFQKNHAEFINRLDSLDQWIQNELAGRKNDVFLLFHPALTYYARDYGLKQQSLELEGKQPSPAHFKRITEMANDHHIQHVFIQKQFDVENAEMLAQQINAEVIEINPLDEHWEEQMVAITRKLKTALNTAK